MRAREKQFVAEWNSDRRSSFPLHHSNFGDSNRVVVGRLDPRAPPLTWKQRIDPKRRFDRSQECRRTPIPPLLCRFGLIPGVRQFDIDQVKYPLDRQDYAAIGEQTLWSSIFLHVVIWIVVSGE
jgi:hypothetical protein